MSMTPNTQEAKPKKKAKITRANKSLAERIGYGPLDKRIVASCETTMRLTAQTQDFKSMAQQFLEQLEQGITLARSDTSAKKAIQAMVSPVMQLKANAKLFEYELVGRLANIMLSFLESIDQVDNDVIDIVDAHHQTLTMIIAKEIKGNAGGRGELFEKELKDAVNRYHTKRKPLKN